MVAKAYGYVKLAGKDKNKDPAFARQQKSINGYAKQYGFGPIIFYQGLDAPNLEKGMIHTAFGRMVSDLVKNNIKTVIVEGLDCLVNDFEVQEQLIIYLASKGDPLISARTIENVTRSVMEDPVRQKMIRNQEVFAELERNLLNGKSGIA